MDCNFDDEVITNYLRIRKKHNTEKLLGRKIKLCGFNKIGKSEM